MAPLISVLIPSYNYRHYIENAIDSVRAQTYTNVEIVVTDNCSTDGTVDLLRERYAGDERVRIFVNEQNIGMIRNARRGYELARGEFLLWLSCDDWLLPQHLQRLYATFDAHPQLDVVYSGAYFADEPGRVYGMRQLPGQFPVDYVDAREELIEMLTSTCPLCWPTALFRRSVIEELGLSDPDGPLAADWELQIRYALAGKRFAYLAEPSTVVRLHGSQATGDDYHASGRNVTDFLGILEMYVDHPEMVRVRGRERGIANYLNALASAARAHTAGVFGAEENARIEAMIAALVRRADRYEPEHAPERVVSVILPAFGPPQMSMRSLESIRTQLGASVEAVVVDAGPVPLHHLVEPSPAGVPVRYVRAAGVALPVARNLGLRLARGEYVAFLEEGNVLAPDHVMQLQRAIAGVGTRWAHANSRLVIERSDGMCVEREDVGSSDEVFFSPDDPRELLGVANALPLNAVLFHRSALDLIGRFNESLPVLDDFEFLLRLARVGPAAASARTTVEVRTRLGLAVSSLGAQIRNYLGALDAIYAGHVRDDLRAQRARHREALVAVLGQPNDALATPQGIANFYGVFAGRAVFRPPVHA